MPYDVQLDDVREACKLAHRFARRSGMLHFLDEWESAAVFGLGQAAVAFQPDEGVRFWTFAHARVVGAILDAARRSFPRGYRRSERRAAGQNGEAWQPPILLSLSKEVGGTYLIPSEDLPVGWEIEEHDEIERHARRLTPPVARVFRVHYARSRLQSRTARILGLCESRVSKALRDAHIALATAV